MIFLGYICKDIKKKGKKPTFRLQSDIDLHQWLLDVKV